MMEVRPWMRDRKLMLVVCRPELSTSNANVPSIGGSQLNFIYLDRSGDVKNYAHASLTTINLRLLTYKRTAGTI